MNRNDAKLILIILSISITTFLGFRLFEKNGSKQAIVYYEDKAVLTIDLSHKDKQVYEVEGDKGKVVIIAENGQVRVDEEKSPLHLCSKQGNISKSYESIICLPNKITIKINTNDKIDTVVK